jgi:prophage antirepressor-like protein
MNDLTIGIFKNPKYGEVRTILVDGKEYFVANDIARNLGYAVPKDAIAAHCKGAVKYRLPTPGGDQEMNCIPIGDVCRLAAKSELPGAAEYESWIFDEVLPAIHKTGGYVANTSPLALFEQMLLVAKNQEQRVKVLESSVQVIRDTLCDRPEDWRKAVNDMIRAAAKREGCTDSYPAIWRKAYERLEGRAHCDLDRRLDGLRSRRNNSKLGYLDVIAEDYGLRENFLAIVKEIAVAHAV